MLSFFVILKRERKKYGRIDKNVFNDLIWNGRLDEEFGDETDCGDE